MPATDSPTSIRAVIGRGGGRLRAGYPSQQAARRRGVGLRSLLGDHAEIDQ
jgi:hypothetical protein